MQTPVLLLFLSTLIFLLGIWIASWVHGHTQMDIKLPPVPPPDSPPRISVIVPARNEARNIRDCVEALLRQTYPNYEVIVVDDRSSDATPHILAEILRGYGGTPPLHVVSGQEPPPGWAGKPHALVQGAAAARGDWLCFVDADTFATPHLLSSALAGAQAHQADCLSLLTDQILDSFWEKTILPVIFTALAVGFPADRVNDPNTEDAIANGQFILIRTAAYNDIGGHAAVRDQIAEDKALADLVKRRGYRLVLADGRALARTRMYTSLGEIWEGWTKNIFFGMQERTGLLILGAVVGLFGALVLPAWLLGGLVWKVVRPGWIPAVVVAQALVFWAYVLSWRIRAARAFQISPWYALTFPLGILIFTLMMAASTLMVLSGRGVTWKGRRYT